MEEDRESEVGRDKEGGTEEKLQNYENNFFLSLSPCTFKLA